MPLELDTQSPDTQRCLAKIGEIVIKLNMLEGRVEFWIWQLIAANGEGLDKQTIGRIITTPLSYYQKVQLLKSLIMERSGVPLNKTLKTIINKVEQCGEQRNDAAHSLWLIGQGTQPDTIATKFNSGKGFKWGREKDWAKIIQEVRIEDLDGWIRILDEAADELMQVMLTSS